MKKNEKINNKYKNKNKNISNLILTSLHNYIKQNISMILKLNK